MLPGIGVSFPSFAARLAGGGNRVGTPELVAGIRVQRIDVGARTLVAATATDDQLVVDHKRSRSQGAVSFLGIVELDSPDELAGVGLGPDDLAIGGTAMPPPDGAISTRAKPLAAARKSRRQR